MVRGAGRTEKTEGGGGMNAANIPKEWLPSDRFVGRCARCGKHALKQHMWTLSTRKGAAKTKTWCHLCDACFAALAEELDAAER